MPFDYGLRLRNRQRLANARAKPIEANKNQSVDGAEGLFLRGGSPQNVYLLPQHPNLRLERCPRPKQICDHPNNELDKISHPATASPDSRSTASQIEFAIGTPQIPGACHEHTADRRQPVAGNPHPRGRDVDTTGGATRCACRRCRSTKGFTGRMSILSCSLVTSPASRTEPVRLPTTA
jgi:hypothetical protein